jgi:peroxiredoxin
VASQGADRCLRIRGLPLPCSWAGALAVALGIGGCASTSTPSGVAPSVPTLPAAARAGSGGEHDVIGRQALPLEGIALVSGELPPTWKVLRGEIVVLEFGAPWCGVCALVHQRMNEWQQQWAMYGVEFIGIVAATPEEARSYVQRFGIGYAVAADVRKSAFRAYDVVAVPSLFLIDRRGTIVDATTGYLSQRLAYMERELQVLVGQPEAS